MRILINLIKYFFVYVIKRQSFGMYIKNVAENMSIAYIKLAQILSTRSDILSSRSIEDLKLINDECNILSFKEIYVILKEEYGKNLFSIFKSIDKEPIGSASISQVHKAVLTTGEIVAIKIKRKDVVANVEKDIKFMNNVLKFFSHFSKKIKYLYNSRALDSYFEWIKLEVNFNNEKENIKKVCEHFSLINSKNNLKNCKKMLSIKCYEEFCTDNIIVMEYVSYKTLNKIELNGECYETISNALNSALRQYFFALFELNEIYFHGDPHMGNIYIDNNGNLGFLDYGLVFKFTKEQIDIIKVLAINIYTKNIKNMYNILMQITQKYGYTSKERKKELKLKKDLIIYFNKIDDIKVTNWFMEMAFICIDNNLYVPKYYYEFAKSFAALDGILLTITDNMTANELLEEQFKEYIVKEKINKACKSFKEISSCISFKQIYNMLR